MKKVYIFVLLNFIIINNGIIFNAQEFEKNNYQNPEVYDYYNQKTVEYGANWTYGHRGTWAYSNLFSSTRSHSTTTCDQGYCNYSGSVSKGKTAESGDWDSNYNAVYYYNIW